MKSLGVLLLTIMLSVTGCAAVKQTKQPEQMSHFFIEGTIQSVAGKELELVLKMPQFKIPESPIHQISQQLIQKSLFLEGIQTEIDGQPSLIKEVRGNNVIILLEKARSYPVGATVKLKIPKKVIAIMDFEVVRGSEKEVGRITLEELTSLLIESGHFTVVERQKLKTVLSEIELSQTGLMQEPQGKAVGKLLMADLILTGTLSEMQGNWDINLRLVDVRTGRASAAITMRTPLFQPSDIRETKLLQDFSRGVDPSWNPGHFKLAAGYYNVSLDRNVGAEDAKGSLRIDFYFPPGIERSLARVRNEQSRDLSFYQGIEFYIKGTRPLFGTFSLMTSHPDDRSKVDLWVGQFEIQTEWKKIVLPFNKLILGTDWRESARRKMGDHVFRPHRVETISIGVWSTRNRPGRGTVWIDKIRSYK
jgi:TolB-like protein